ncbi:hypothetical protein [Amycolatopsis sp. NPDC054798]
MAQPVPEPGNWLNGLAFTIGDSIRESAAAAGQAALGSGPGSGGQGFSLSHDEAVRMLALARSIRTDLGVMIPEAEQITKMKPPADEPASKEFNALAAGADGKVGAFRYGVGHIQRECAYVDELIERLEGALHLIRSGEHEAVAAAQGSAARHDGLV